MSCMLPGMVSWWQSHSCQESTLSHIEGGRSEPMWPGTYLVVQSWGCGFWIPVVYRHVYRNGQHVSKQSRTGGAYYIYVYIKPGLRLMLQSKGENTIWNKHFRYIVEWWQRNEKKRKTKWNIRNPWTTSNAVLPAVNETLVTAIHRHALTEFACKQTKMIIFPPWDFRLEEPASILACGIVQLRIWCQL